MLKDDLQNEIVVKTAEGGFKLFKGGDLAELPSDELMVPEDDIVAFKGESIRALKQEKPTANFYFDVEDEHETRQLKAKNEEDKNRMIKEYIEATLEEIVSEAGLGEELKSNLQFKNIIVSRLKGVRSLAEAREAFLRSDLSQSSGAQDLTKEEINRLLDLIERKRAEVEEAIKTGVIPANQEIKKTRNQENKKTIKQENIKRLEHKRVDSIGVKYEKKPEVVGGDELSQHITTGPVEEIKNLSLKDFRRLGSSPKEAVDRILEKISLLEDESLIKKAEGIQAWKKSEIYRLYLEIGAVSMAEKKPVEQVIREYKQAGKSFLAPGEFNEVADLNRQLSY